MIAESGLQRRSGVDGLTDTLETTLGLDESGHDEKKPVADRKSTSVDDETPFEPEEHQDMIQLNAMLIEVEENIKNAIKSGNTKLANELKQRKDDILRLKRVEQVYVRLPLIRFVAYHVDLTHIPRLPHYLCFLL